MTTDTTSTPEFFVTPGFGETALAQLRYSQAVRVGDTVRTSGQGGWNDDLEIPESLETEIVQAFDNVERALAAAGATWADVVEVNSYHVTPSSRAIFEDHNEVMVEQFRLRTGGRAPIWTEVGVAALALAAMRIEIRVTAVVGGHA